MAPQLAVTGRVALSIGRLQSQKVAPGVEPFRWAEFGDGLMMRVEIHRNLERLAYRSDSSTALHDRMRRAGPGLDPLELALDGALATRRISVGFLGHTV